MKKTFCLRRRSDHRRIAGGLHHPMPPPSDVATLRPASPSVSSAACSSAAQSPIRGRLMRNPRRSTWRRAPCIVDQQVSSNRYQASGSCGRCASPADGRLKRSADQRSSQVHLSVKAGSHEPAICMAHFGLFGRRNPFPRSATAEAQGDFDEDSYCLSRCSNHRRVVGWLRYGGLRPASASASSPRWRCSSRWRRC